MFVSNVNPPNQKPTGTVAGDGWWPDVDADRMLKDCRFDATVTPERLRQAVVLAVADITGQLEAWRAEQEAAGHASLDKVPARQVDGKSIKPAQFLRAVQSHVQAELAEAYRDLDTLPNGEGKEWRVLSRLEIRVDTFQRNLRNAIADLRGRRRTIVELI